MRRTIAAVVTAALFALGAVQAQEQADFNIPELTGTWTTDPAFADLYVGDQATQAQEQADFNIPELTGTWTTNPAFADQYVGDQATQAREQADFNIPELTGTWTTNPAFADEYQDDRRAIEAHARIASRSDRRTSHRSTGFSNSEN